MTLGSGDSAFYFAAEAAPLFFGLGPRLRACRRRRVLVSSRARNVSEPTEPPMLSPLRRRGRPFVLVGLTLNEAKTSLRDAPFLDPTPGKGRTPRNI